MAAVAADEQVGSGGNRRSEDPIVGGITAPGFGGSWRRQIGGGDLVQQSNQVFHDRRLNLQLLDENAPQFIEDQTGNKELERSLGSDLQQSARRAV